MPKRNRSNPLALAVLSLLRERPMHPYEMSTTLRERAKEASIRLNYGSLYSVVEGLAKRGLIRARETVREGRRPERTVYEITAAGETEHSDWLSDLLAIPEKEYPHFEAALSLMAGLPPDDVVPLLELRAQRLELTLHQLRSLEGLALEQGLSRLFVVEGEYEAAMMDAELRFVRQLIVEIRDGTLDTDQWREIHAQLGKEVAAPDPS